ncbi:MAG: hypothetical protein ACYS3N_10695 [Planctomycetota bacterium]|jgi:hypothetical protein
MRLKNKHITVNILFTFLLLLSSNTVAIASGSGLGGAMFFWRNTSDSTGQREIINLDLRGNVLFGLSKKSKRIHMITVCAPGIKESRLILREIENADGTLTFFFSGPKSLSERISKMTVFCYHPYCQYRLIQYVNGTFKSYDNTTIPVSEIEPAMESHDSLLAFVINNLGMYWVVNSLKSEESQQLLPANYASPTTPLAGGLYRGLLPLSAAVLLLLVGSAVSYYSHKENCRVRI